LLISLAETLTVTLVFAPLRTELKDVPIIPDAVVAKEVFVIFVMPAILPLA